MNYMRSLSSFRRQPSTTRCLLKLANSGTTFADRRTMILAAADICKTSLQMRRKFENNFSSAVLFKERWQYIGKSKRFYCEGERQVSSFNVQDYDDFKERVLNSDKPVVVDFYADWCGPCKMLGPRLEMVVDNRGGKVMLAKVNVDDCADLAMDYGVRSVPTVIAFQQGQPIEQFVGLKEEEQIDAFINKLSKQSE